ncbi:tetratricopeptide repeat protein [Aeoliella sp. SH292]|uniref:tetratricopeptide repeat protein n=1 Tax=Aeoliella sp. SH292 TaxID=3454464 RepID=UPI003F9BBB76
MNSTSPARVWIAAVAIALLASAPVHAQQAKSSAAAVAQYNVAARYQKLGEFDLALAEWQKLAKDHARDPLAATATHYTGICQFQLAKYPEATKSFEAFLKSNPKHELAEQAVANLGLARYNQAQRLEGDAANKQYQQAIADFDRLAKQFPKSELAPQSQFYRAESMYALGQLKEAQAAYQDWLAKNKENELAPSVWLALGVTQNELGETDAAIKTLEELLATTPPQPVIAQATLRLGDALAAANRPKEAAERYAEAIALGGDIDASYAAKASASALFNAGEFVAAAEAYEKLGDIASAGKALYQAGDYASAAAQLAKASAAAPADADLAHWWVRSLVEAGEPEAAIEAADQVLAKQKSADVLLDKAEALYAIDARRGESLAAYIVAADAAEGELAAEARNLAAATALELGDLAAAKQQAGLILAKHGDSSFATDARLTLAEAQLQSGEAKEAAATFAELLKTATDEQRADWSVRLAWAQSTADDEAGVLETLANLNAPLDTSAGQQAAFLVGRAKFRTGDFQGAIASLRPLTEQNPPSDWTAESQLLVGRALQSSGDAARAITTLTQLIDSGPAAQLAAQAHYRRAEAATTANEPASAIADYDKLASTWADNPLAPYALYRAATLVMKQGEHADAATRFAKLVTDFPDHALATEAKLGQATCLAQTGENDAAAKVLATLGTDDPRVALALGSTLAGQKKWDEAIATLEKVTAAPGEFADRDRAWYELAWAYREAGQGDKSRAAFEELATEFADSPLHADALFRVAEGYYEADDYAEAAARYTAAADAAKQDAELHEKSLHMVGWSEQKSGDHAAAATAFSAQLAAHPDGPLAPDAKWMAGEAQFAAEKYPEALAAYTAAKDAKPSAESLAPLGMLHAGQAAAQQEDWQGSIDWLSRAVNEYPEFDGRNEIDYELGWALSKLGKTDEAMPLLTKVADRDTSPVGARAQFVVGELQFAQKNYEEAVRTFFKVAYGYGDGEAPEAYHHWQAESLFEAARCLEQLDRGSAAKKLYQELVERFPEEAKAKLAQARLTELGE